MRRQLIVGALFLALGSAVARADVMSVADAARLFGARESNWAPELSPSGKQMLFFRSGEGARTELELQDLKTADISELTFSSGTPEQLLWCDFATESDVICEFGGEKAEGGQIVTFSRLVAINTGSRSMRPLGNKATGYDKYIRQYDGEIVDWMHDQPGSVLVARTYVPQVDLGEMEVADKREGLGVDRIDLATLKSTSVVQPNNRASKFLSDGHGRIRLAGFDQAELGEQLTGITEFRFRSKGSDQWMKLATYDERTDSGLLPVAIDDATNAAYALERVDGRDALFEVKLDGSGTRTLIAKNDKVDIDGIVRLDRGKPVIGYRYSDERRHIVYFDPTYRSLANSLTAALPKSPLIYFQSASSDESKLLVYASSDTDAGAYYLLDRSSKEMHPVLLSREPLENRPLAPVRPISFAAADGTSIPAYLTVPTVRAGPRGAVVLPHGGPSARDQWGFDWLTQFFAARGYVVIQPNFRGSSGYGADFEGQNAFRDWRTAMSDIDDCAAYLVKEGLADPERIAIVGWSYGGYAALESEVLHPGRYKAVVAIAPVTDLNALKRDSSGFTNAKLVKDYVGPKGSAEEGSPLESAGRISAPVLLVHGELDANVRIEHSLRMAEALQKSHAPVEFLRFPKLDHQLEDSNARIQMLTKIGELLERSIGH
ncbi:MAG: alpha/beta hydrolase family protein [Sphingomonas sp.]